MGSLLWTQSAECERYTLVCACQCVRRSAHRSASYRRKVGSKTVFIRKGITITIDHLRIAATSLWRHAGANYKHTQQKGETVAHHRLAQYMRNRCTCESRPGESSPPPHPRKKKSHALQKRTQTGMVLKHHTTGHHEIREHHTGHSLGCGMSSCITQRSIHEGKALRVVAGNPLAAMDVSITGTMLALVA